MQRVQYHHNTWLSEDLQIDTSKRLNKMRNIKNFIADKTWIKGISDAEKNHYKGTQEASLECIEIEDEDHLDAQPKINLDQRKSPPKSPQKSVVNLVFHDVEFKSDLDDVIFDLVNNKTKERGNNTTFRIRQLDSSHGEKTAVAYRVQQKDKKIKPHDFHDDLCVSAIHKTPALKTYSVRRKKASSNGELKSVTEPVVKPATADQNFTTTKTFSLEDQVQIIDDYEDAEMEELNIKTVEQGIDRAQIGNDLLPSDQTTVSNEHMEIEQTLETPQDEEVDIEKIVMDIKIELPELQPVCESTVKAVEPSEPPILKTVTTSPIVDDDDEVMPRVTNNYEEALKKLKSLEEFALLEENYRAIGLITQLESIFKNPPIREK